MKKSVIYSTALAASLIAGATGIVAINNTTAANAADANGAVVATASDFATKKIANSKDELVYVMTNADGEVKNKFIGSALYTGEEALPFEMKVRYYLDGAEISASELAGKSGHVKIVYSFDANAWYNGVRIPFLAVTGMSFDGAKFSNVKLHNGKVVSEGDNYVVVGYALLGVNETLGTDLLPSEFIMEADVNGFEMGTTYTLLTNEMIAEIDTTRLADVDGLVSSMNQLADGLEQIIGGAGQLHDGLGDLVANTKLLAAGVDDLSAGLGTLTQYNDGLNLGAQKIFLMLLAQANATIAAQSGQNPEMTIENYAATLDYMINATEAEGGDATALRGLKGSLDEYNAFYSGLAGYTAGVAEAAAGAEEMAAKMPALVEGETKLYAGAGALTDGLDEFKTSGVNKLVDFANKDLKNFTYNARRMVTAAANYKSYGDRNAETVKFVVKTASVK